MFKKHQQQDVPACFCPAIWLDQQLRSFSQLSFCSSAHLIRRSSDYLVSLLISISSERDASCLLADLLLPPSCLHRRPVHRSCINNLVSGASLQLTIQAIPKRKCPGLNGLRSAHLDHFRRPHLRTKENVDARGPRHKGPPVGLLATQHYGAHRVRKSQPPGAHQGSKTDRSRQNDQKTGREMYSKPPQATYLRYFRTNTSK